MNQTALITGASSGIGAELSKLFAADGYSLVLVARSQDRLAQLAAALQQAHPVQVSVLAKDLSLPGAAQEIFDALAAQGSTVDVLVNNAGYGTHGLFATQNLDEQLAMLQVNLVSLVQLTRLFLPGMLQRGRGRILNLGSTGSFAPTPLMAGYSASKAFVLSFSEALSEELRPTPVTVTVLCPGVTLTGFQERARVGNIRMLRGPSMSAEAVARIGYRGLMRGQAVVTPGFFNQLMAFSVRLTPRWLVRRLSHQMVKNES